MLKLRQGPLESEVINQMGNLPSKVGPGGYRNRRICVNTCVVTPAPSSRRLRALSKNTQDNLGVRRACVIVIVSQHDVLVLYAAVRLSLFITLAY